MKARMAALQTFVLTASMITWMIYDEGACADGSFVFVTQIPTCHHSLLQGMRMYEVFGKPVEAPCQPGCLSLRTALRTYNLRVS